MAKATKKQALGRGLSALLKDSSNDIKSVTNKNTNQVLGSIVALDLHAIEMNPFQPRSSFNEESNETFQRIIHRAAHRAIHIYSRLPRASKVVRCKQSVLWSNVCEQN